MSDLQVAFCGGQTCTTLAHANGCYSHWISNGQAEGRGPDPDACLAAPSTCGRWGWSGSGDWDDVSCTQEKPAMCKIPESVSWEPRDTGSGNFVVTGATTYTEVFQEGGEAWLYFRVKGPTTTILNRAVTDLTIYANNMKNAIAGGCAVRMDSVDLVWSPATLRPCTDVAYSTSREIANVRERIYFDVRCPPRSGSSHITLLGTNGVSLRSATVDECDAACESNTDCKHFERGPDGNCYLYGRAPNHCREAEDDCKLA